MIGASLQAGKGTPLEAPGLSRTTISLTGSGHHPQRRPPHVNILHVFEPCLHQQKNPETLKPWRPRNGTPLASHPYLWANRFLVVSRRYDKWRSFCFVLPNTYFFPLARMVFLAAGSAFSVSFSAFDCNKFVPPKLASSSGHKLFGKQRQRSSDLAQLAPWFCFPFSGALEISSN